MAPNRVVHANDGFWIQVRHCGNWWSTIIPYTERVLDDEPSPSLFTTLSPNGISTGVSCIEDHLACIKQCPSSATASAGCCWLDSSTLLTISGFLLMIRHPLLWLLRLWLCFHNGSLSKSDGLPRPKRHYFNDDINGLHLDACLVFWPLRLLARLPPPDLLAHVINHAGLQTIS